MRILPLLLLAACDGPNKDTATETDTDTDTDTDFQPPLNPDEGSLVLLRTMENGTLVDAELAAIFASSSQGYVNAAQCARTELTPCLRDLPDVGTRMEYDPQDRFTPAGSLFRYVGLTIDFGPFEAVYEPEGDLDYSFYYADVTDQGEFTGPADLSLGVQWGDFSDTVTTVRRSST